MSILAGRAIRLALAAALLLACATAARSPLVPLWLTAGAAALLVLSTWRPQWGLLLLLLAAPWGARLADVPVRATEYLAAAFLAGWLLRVDRPLRPDAAVRPALVPALIYGALAMLSWMRLAAERSTGELWTRTFETVRLLPADYLVTAGRDPHTATMLQILLGVALFWAVCQLAVAVPGAAARILLVVALGGAVAAAATVVAVPIRYLMSGDLNELIRYFVVTRSRYAFHVPDVNAAGSHFILSGLLALGMIVHGGRLMGAGVASTHARWRAPWVAGLAFLAAALWISGSRAAMAAGGVLALFFVQGWRLVSLGWRWPRLAPRTLAGAAAVALALLIVSPLVVGSASAMSGSASRSMGVREEFLITSARMIATAPVLGVGVGTYYQRSTEFMPPGIRALYGRENAHNYFLQTTAELGVIGLAAFVWWLGRALWPVWQTIDAKGTPAAPLALLVACLGYLLTCVTGHPLLVVEVSVPFWAALGVAAAAGGRTQARPPEGQAPAAGSRAIY